MAPPINDNLVDAIDVLDGVLKETIAGTIVDATTEPNFEAHGSYGVSQAVWYHFAPTVDFRLAIRVTKTGGDAGFVPEADLLLATTYPPVDFDDFTFMESVGDGTASPPREHKFPLLAGEHYYIAVLDYNYDPGEEGTFDLDVQAVPSYLYENWEEASIDPIVWELHRSGTTPIDPNAGIFTIETSPVGLGSQSVKGTPNGVQEQQLFHHDQLAGGDLDRDYWVAFKFYVDWAVIDASPNQLARLPGILNGNENAFPHTGSGLVAASQDTFLYPFDSTSGEFEALDGSVYTISDGWHELRSLFRKRSSDNHLIVTQILDGVTVMSAEDTGTYGGTITGVQWRVDPFDGSMYIDPLVWSPDTDPGPLVEAGAVTPDFIASTTTLFTPSLTGTGSVDVDVPFISPTGGTFDPLLTGDQDIPAPFISPTTTVFTPTLLGPNRVRVSQLPVEVGVQPTDAKARLSQIPVEVAEQPPSAARLSQMVVEIPLANRSEDDTVIWFEWLPKED